jgi:hypothetical protein
MEGLAGWLVTTSAHGMVVRYEDWLVPLARTIHLLGICVTLTIALLTALRLADITGTRWTPARWGRRFGFWGALGFFALLASGLLLIVVDPANLLTNRLFQAKLLLLPVAWLVARHLSGRLHRLDRAPPLTTDKLLSWTLIFLWLTIIACGKWVNYAG